VTPSSEPARAPGGPTPTATRHCDRPDRAVHARQLAIGSAQKTTFASPASYDGRPATPGVRVGLPTGSLIRALARGRRAAALRSEPRAIRGPRPSARWRPRQSHGRGRFRCARGCRGYWPVSLTERMCVRHRQRSVRRVPDVCHEGSRTYLARLGSEPAILERGDRLLVDAGWAVRIEIADAGAVGILMALGAQAVSRSEQPERRPHGLVARAHPEQSTHPREPYGTSASAIR
jgi:hypothetical protein